jgi:calcineurin-like phosphoesterase family protein
MKETWVLADTHFDHAAILKYANRPFSSVEDMNAAIVENCKVIHPGDTVIIVGDYAWKRHQHWIHAIRGKKILVRGNHDKMNRECYSQFTEVHDILERNIHGQFTVFCHYAMRVWNKRHYGAWHLYGHSHGALAEYANDMSFDVGVDVWQFRPIPWEVIVKKMQWKKIHELEFAMNTNHKDTQEIIKKNKELNLLLYPIASTNESQP